MLSFVTCAVSAGAVLSGSVMALIGAGLAGDVLGAATWIARRNRSTNHRDDGQPSSFRHLGQLGFQPESRTGVRIAGASLVLVGLFIVVRQPF